MQKGKIIGEYEIGRAIGEGTFGKVFLGTNIFTGELAAIKQVSRKKKKSVKKEVEILRQLDHPNIVHLYDFFESKKDNICYMICEYIPGGELYDYIAQRGRLDEVSARSILRQLVSGIEYCHSLMIVHRDLKPENLLMDHDGAVKISDFGLSNIIKPGKLFTTFCGSLHYASPEILNGLPYLGYASDIWSLGIILYCLVVGRQPWDAENPDDFLNAIREEGLVVPMDISDSCVDCLLRMLKINEDERILVQELRTHPWLMEGYDEPPKSHLPETTITEIDPKIIRQLKRIGFSDADSEDSIAEILSNAKTQLAVTYGLLESKKKKNKRKRKKSDSKKIFISSVGGKRKTNQHRELREKRKRSKSIHSGDREEKRSLSNTTSDSDRSDALRGLNITPKKKSPRQSHKKRTVKTTRFTQSADFDPVDLPQVSQSPPTSSLRRLGISNREKRANTTAFPKPPEFTFQDIDIDTEENSRPVISLEEVQKGKLNNPINVQRARSPSKKRRKTILYSFDGAADEQDTFTLSTRLIKKKLRVILEQQFIYYEYDKNSYNCILDELNFTVFIESLENNLKRLLFKHINGEYTYFSHTKDRILTDMQN